MGQGSTVREALHLRVTHFYLHLVQCNYMWMTVNNLPFYAIQAFQLLIAVRGQEFELDTALLP